jgi:hypothetical protein
MQNEESAAIDEAKRLDRHLAMFEYGRCPPVRKI